MTWARPACGSRDSDFSGRASVIDAVENSGWLPARNAVIRAPFNFTPDACAARSAWQLVQFADRDLRQRDTRPDARGGTARNAARP